MKYYPFKRSLERWLFGSVRNGHRFDLALTLLVAFLIFWIIFGILYVFPVTLKPY